MKRYIHEVLTECVKKRAKADKIKVLQDNDSWALRDVLRGAMDSTVQWDLPPGAPPYTPNKPESVPSNLLKENVKFKYFIKNGPGKDLMNVKREKIFIGLLESIHPEDAKLVIKVIQKETPLVKGLTRPVVEEAFPGLLKD